MSKDSHEVTESVVTRLCEWRGMNCCYLLSCSLAVFSQCPDKYLLTKQITRKIQSSTIAIQTPMAP